MRNKLTLVVPTFNRHHLLARVLPYLSEMDIPILIIDSTETPYKTPPAHPGIEYVHCPDLDFIPKMQKYVSEKVKTQYMLLNADDMLPSQSFIADSLDFLETHPDYSAVQGASLGLREGNVVFAHAPDHYLYPTDSKRASARLLQHFTSYCPIAYAVHQTNCLIESLNRFPFEVINYNFQEFYFCMMLLIQGKINRVQYFSHVTDLVPSINATSWRLRGTTKDMRSNPSFFGDIMALKHTVASFLAQKEEIEYECAFRYVEAALDMYIARILPSKDYYWLRTKPPQTFSDRLKKEWSNAMNKYFRKEQREKAKKLAKQQSREHEIEAIRKSCVDNYEEFLSILKSFGITTWKE